MTRSTRVRNNSTGETSRYTVDVSNGDGTFGALGDAGEAAAGLVELSTNAEAVAGVDTARAVTPAGLAAAVAGHVPSATTSVQGKVELATNAEAQAETDTGRALTPSTLRQGAPALSAGTLEASFPQHYQCAPAAVSATAVHAAMNLTGSTQEISSAITNPDVPRTATVKGNVAGIAGNVVLHGTNIEGEAITDTLALNGSSEVEGVKAFKTITQIDLPAQTHTPAAQVETAVAVGTITLTGNATVTVTAAGMTGSPKSISVAVLENDTAAQWADKVRTALGLDADVTALFSVSGADENIILTRLAPAANDATLNIALANDTCTGITDDATSNDTTAGVPTDTVSVGRAKKLGLPHIVDNAALLLVKLFDGSSDNGSLAVDADEIEKNLYALDGAPNGAKLVDLYSLV